MTVKVLTLISAYNNGLNKSAFNWLVAFSINIPQKKAWVQ
jgi:hypothetical protein